MRASPDGLRLRTPSSRRVGSSGCQPSGEVAPKLLAPLAISALLRVSSSTVLLRGPAAKLAAEVLGDPGILLQHALNAAEPHPIDPPTTQPGDGVVPLMNGVARELLVGELPGADLSEVLRLVAAGGVLPRSCRQGQSRAVRRLPGAEVGVPEESEASLVEHRQAGRKAHRAGQRAVIQRVAGDAWGPDPRELAWNAMVVQQPAEAAGRPGAREPARSGPGPLPVLLTSSRVLLT